MIEDESEIAELVAKSLRSYRFEVSVFFDGASGLTACERKQPDICIIDLNLPDIDGMELVKGLQNQGVGIIILSGRDCLTDRVVGLEFGADDYVTKPFEPRELVARVQSLQRRLESIRVVPEVADKDVAHFGGFSFDTKSLTLTRPDSQRENLSRAESDMLLALIRSPFQILSRDQLLGENCVPYDRSIDVRISRLRKKLSVDQAEPLVKTVYGAGYMLTTQVEWK